MTLLAFLVPGNAVFISQVMQNTTLLIMQGLTDAILPIHGRINVIFFIFHGRLSACRIS